MVGKKAFIFSVLSMIIVFVFGVLVSVLTTNVSLYSQPASLSEAEFIDYYYELLQDHYLPSILKVSTTHVLSSMNDYVYTSGNYFPAENFSLFYEALYENGTFDITIDATNYAFSGTMHNTLSNWSLFLENTTGAILRVPSGGVTITPLYETIVLSQEVPWEVDVSMRYNVSFIAGDVHIFNDAMPISTTVSILGFKDPLLFGTYGQNITIKNSTSVLNEWDVNQLEFFVNTSTFVQNDHGPSFLMRLANERNFSKLQTGTSSGMQFFINPYLAELLGESSMQKRSFVDYHFIDNSFSNCAISDDSFDTLYNITTLYVNSSYPSFILDLNNSLLYLGDDFNESTLDVVCSN